MRLLDLCSVALSTPYGMTHADMPIRVPPASTNERYECENCQRTVLVNIHGRCAICDSSAVISTAQIS